MGPLEPLEEGHNTGMLISSVDPAAAAASPHDRHLWVGSRACVSQNVTVCVCLCVCKNVCVYVCVCGVEANGRVFGQAMTGTSPSPRTHTDQPHPAPPPPPPSGQLGYCSSVLQRQASSGHGLLQRTSLQHTERRTLDKGGTERLFACWRSRCGSAAGARAPESSGRGTSPGDTPPCKDSRPGSGPGPKDAHTSRPFCI